MATVIDIEKWAKAKRKEEKRKERKAKIKRGVDNAVDFAKQNPGVAIAVATGLLGGIGYVVKSTGKQIQLHQQKQLKELYWWDPSLGHYWKLSRALTNSEARTVDQRHQNGERLADILHDLGVLK